MNVSDTRVFKKMDVRWFLFKMLLFQTLVAWCGAKHVTIKLNSPMVDVEGAEEVQDSIRNLIHTGKSSAICIHTYSIFYVNVLALLFRLFIDKLSSVRGFALVVPG